MKKLICFFILSSVACWGSECPCGLNDQCDVVPWQRYHQRHKAERALDKIFRGERVNSEELTSLKTYWESLLAWQRDYDNNNAYNFRNSEK